MLLCFIKSNRDKLIYRDVFQLVDDEGLLRKYDFDIAALL